MGGKFYCATIGMSQHKHDRSIQDKERIFDRTSIDSKLMETALGSHTYQVYIHSKMAEWDEYRIQVTEWEHKKYFETT